MKRIWLLPVLLFLGITQLVAQAPKSSLLWEISGNGLQNPSYIFGTFHIMCKPDFTVTNVLESKIKSSQQFFGEIDLDQSNLRADMMTKMMMQDKTLQSLMGDSDYVKVSNKFKDITGMPMAMMNNFKPFLCMSLLAFSSADCNDIVQPEMEFVSVAKQNNIPIRGLETIDDQLNAIDKEPLDSQINDLKKAVLNFDSIKTDMSKFKAIYKRRDIDVLYSFMKTSGISEDFSIELINKRNEKWIPVIQKAITEKPSFFAVGAGHLGGPEGVISLLRKQGYRLTPVQF